MIVLTAVNLIGYKLRSDHFARSQINNIFLIISGKLGIERKLLEFRIGYQDSQRILMQAASYIIDRAQSLTGALRTGEDQSTARVEIMRMFQGELTPILESGKSTANIYRLSETFLIHIITSIKKRGISPPQEQG